MSRPRTVERIEQPHAGYTSDVTTISSRASQLDLTDTSRPSLTLARNRTSQTGIRRGRSGLRAGSTEEDLSADQAEALTVGLGFKSNDIWQMSRTPQDGDYEEPTGVRTGPIAGFGKKAHKALHDDGTGSISSAIQPNSSDTPASQRDSESDSDSRQLLSYSEPTLTSSTPERPTGRTGLDRIWGWIGSTGASAGNDEYRLLETGVSSKGDEEVKSKHVKSARRKRTKKSRDVKGRLMETDIGGYGQKRLWSMSRRLGTVIMTRPYRSLVSLSLSSPESIQHRADLITTRRLAHLPHRSGLVCLLVDQNPNVRAESGQGSPALARLLRISATQLSCPQAIIEPSAVNTGADIGGL